MFERHGLLTALVLFLGVGWFACSNAQPPSTCPSSHATFKLTVKAEASAVPRDVWISVKYGGGVEHYRAETPPVAPQVVYCKLECVDGGGSDASSADAADGGAQSNIEAVVCDLWTDGAATVTVRASGYPDVVRDLSARRDECGLVLTDVTILLEKAD